MSRIADIALSPGGLVAWVVVGLMTGWLAARVMRGGGFGLAGDMIVAVVGAVIGGLVFGLAVTGEAGFWGGIVVAFLGACLLIAVSRFLGFGHRGN